MMRLRVAPKAVQCDLSGPRGAHKKQVGRWRKQEGTNITALVTDGGMCAAMK
jgi:hypothetical protein